MTSAAQLKIGHEPLIEAGRLLKPHGIKGEISASVDYDDLDLAVVKCIVVVLDGILVPFFPSSVRPKNHATVLLTIDGVTNEQQAAELCNRDYYILESDLPESVEIPDDGFYAADLIGFKAIAPDGSHLGKITDIEDSTQNVLFIIATPKGETLYAPVADEFITDIDADNQIITLDLPDGIANLN